MRRFGFLPGLVLLACCLVGPALAQRNETGLGASLSDAVDKPKGPPKAEEVAPEPADPSLDQEGVTLQKLSLRERVAQLMLVTLMGAPSPDMSDREFLARYTPGGVILPPIARPASVADYITALRQMPMERTSGIAMLIGTNLYDLPRRGNAKVAGSFIPMPSLLAVAAANDPEITGRLSKLAAEHLKVMGFNFHLGPSLELAPTLPGAEGGSACLGSDPRFVAENGAVIAKAMLDSQIISMPMGFPGGGANRVPKMPAILLTPAPLLKDQELLPFTKAIEAGADILHVGNTLVPTLDPSNVPASMSAVVMRDTLRQQMGFEGVIVAGPMDTNDIAIKHDPTEAAMLALEAGADMIYWNQAGQRVMRTVDKIVAAIESGLMSQEIVDSALARVMALKKEHKLLEREFPKAKDAEALGKKKSYANEAYEIERRSITLVQNRGNVLPLNKAASVPVGVTGVAGVDALANALEEYIKPVSRQRIGTAKYGGEIYDFEIDRLTSHIRGIKTVVVIVTPDLRISSQLRLIGALQEAGVRVTVVLLGYPSILPELVDAEAIVLSYTSPEAADASMRAVADVLVGQGPLGILPAVRDVKAKVGVPMSFSVLDVIRAPSGILPVTIEEPFVAGMSVPYDPTFSLKKVEWDFGDGKQSKDFFLERAYESPGRYPITLTVTDKKKQTATRTLHAVVE
ncbi:MAG: hypothetical protein IT364_23505 [Candidatus Hydrogenedentes bacterium]|nr:hypothetical protein [Candidatus Hydrogenedentota bacterium]